MAVQEQIVRQAPFIENRTEQLLQSVFGPQGVANVAYTVPAASVAGFQPLQNTALFSAASDVANANISSGIGAYQPYLGAASQQLGAAGTTMGAGLGAIGQGVNMVQPSNIQQFMDPYQQQVTQNVLAEIDRQGQIAQNQAAAQAVGAGAFGGGREGVQRAELARNLQDIKSRRIAEDLQRNFLQAQQQQLRSAATLGQLGQQTLAGGIAQQGLAEQTAGLGSMAQSAGFRDVGQLLGLGGLQQQQEQMQRDVARQNVLEAQREPLGRIQFASDILRGVPSSQMTYQTQPSPSPFSQLLGAGVGLAGISSLMGNAGFGFS
tara:strand:- start:1631 stop:2590 length:960 start_codon:yes stop_codon:yes gene_type:complete